MKGRPVDAHRLSAEIAGIDIFGKIVRHRCDNRPCVNPAHLVVGTVVDNVRDRQERGRTRWKANGNFKLTDDQVRQIKAEYVRREHGDVAKIARKFSIHPGTVRRIATGARRKGA